MKRWQASLINKEQQHFGLRKLSVGVASVLLGTTVYFGVGNTVANADSQVNTAFGNTGSEETFIDMKVPYAAPIEPAQAQKVVNSAVNYDSNVVNSDTVNSNVENTNAVNSVADNKVEANNNIVANFATQKMTINRNQVQPASVTQVEASTVQSSNNGGFDSNTWGTLDVSKWQGQVVSNTDIDGVTRQYYELTGYNGDMNHIIVPNEADFEKAGVNIGGHQVGINADTTHSWFENGDPKTIAFSKTDNKMVKALGSDWTSAFTGANDRHGSYESKGHKLGKFDGANLNISNVTDMNSMFYENKISDLKPLANWKTDNVTDMSSMFASNQISNLTPLANWKTDKVTNMWNMFYGNPIHNLTPLSSWNTDNVTNMSWMFGLNRISDLTPLASWKTDKVTNMRYMFYGNLISDLTPLANWQTDNVTDMSFMFSSNQISDLTPLSNWKTNNVTNMSNMFSSNQISDLTPLASWKTDNVTDMSFMFGGILNDNQISDLTPLANWKTDNVTDMNEMFSHNQISDLTPLTSWKTDNVTDMSEMFSHNQISDLRPLANWKTDKVTNMNATFDSNQISNLTPLTSWKTGNVTDMSEMFSHNQISDLTPLTNWKTDKVTNMSWMFDSNQISNLTPLANWKTGNVTDMSNMFYMNRISDLTPIVSWKTDNVTNMSGMFYSNQISNLAPLANWKTDNVTSMSWMFTNNQIKLADFRKWDLKQSTNVGNLISSGNNAIILINSANKELLSTDGAITTMSNSISINSDPIDMPTVYATDDMTTPAEKLAEKLVEQARAQKIADYQKAHPTAKISLITPDPTNHAYDAPAIMANQKYRAVVSNKVTYQFVDDDNNGSNVGNMIIVSGEDGSIQKTNLVLPKYYDLVAWQILPYVVVIPTSDTTVTLHLVHTQYNVVIKYFDLSGSLVDSQTITGKWGTTKQVGTLQVPKNYILQSVGVPTQVAISREDAEMDLVVVPALTFRSYINSKDADLRHSVTRTINITKPDKSTQTVVQTVVFGRNAWTNKKTGEITYSNWVPETAPDFVTYVAPQLDGYVPGVVESMTADPAKDNVVADVAYTALPQAVSHSYIDINGQTYDSIPTGYKVVVGQNAKDGAQLIVKDVKPTIPKIEYVTRTITIVMPNHRIRTIKQRVVRGHSFLTAHLPKLRGYQAKISEDVDHVGIGAYTADHDVNVTVVFTK